MNSSIEINELATALCQAQSQMGGAVKDSVQIHSLNLITLI
jgi:hypothetical protein